MPSFEKMNVMRAAQAPDYVPARNFFMRCQRLQGLEAGPSQMLWIGLSTLLPGAHTAVDISAEEPHYVVLTGEVIFLADQGESLLRQYDSCLIAAGERYAILQSLRCARESAGCRTAAADGHAVAPLS